MVTSIVKEFGSLMDNAAALGDESGFSELEHLARLLERAARFRRMAVENRLRGKVAMAQTWEFESDEILTMAAK